MRELKPKLLSDLPPKFFGYSNPQHLSVYLLFFCVGQLVYDLKPFRQLIGSNAFILKKGDYFFERRDLRPVEEL